MEPNEGPSEIKSRKLSIAFLLNDVSIEPRARYNNSPVPIRSKGDIINVSSGSLSPSVEFNDDSSLSSSQNTPQSLKETLVLPLSSLSQDNSFTAESSDSENKRMSSDDTLATQTTFSWTPEEVKKLSQLKGSYLRYTQLNLDVSHFSKIFNGNIYNHSDSLTDTQLKKLRKVLVQDDYPGTHVRECLARELSLDEEKVRRWFTKKKRLFSFQWTAWILFRLYSEFPKDCNLCFQKRESLAAQLNMPQRIVKDWFEEQREQLRTGIIYYEPVPYIHVMKPLLPKWFEEQREQLRTGIIYYQPVPYIHAMKPVLPFMTTALPSRPLFPPPLQNPTTNGSPENNSSSSKGVKDSTAEQNSKE